MADTSPNPETTEPVVWLNGQLSAARTAYISPFDHGLLTGDGVFETLCVYNGKPFAESRHYQRLLNSAAALSLTVPSQETLSSAMTAVIEANKLSNARIRITLTGGVGPLGSDKGASPDLALVAASALPNHAATASIVTVPYRRNEHGALVGIKSTSYGENVAALAYARKHGGNEAIFANIAGNLCEGTGSNIFIVLDGKLITPTLPSGCLAGITRAIVLDLCEMEGIAVDEIDVPIAELDRVDEAFLTSSLREVQPVERINGSPVRICPGPVSSKLSTAFSRLVAEQIDP
ncbi:MAG: aminotransferase class IV family protein [Verrucomicrobiae bacterium]|nr:aminotransferase class IV family protein [Verrucomicrobiae bacterium]